MTTYNKLQSILESVHFFKMSYDDQSKVLEIFDSIDCPAKNDWNPKQHWIEEHLFPWMVEFVDRKFEKLVTRNNIGV